MLAVKEEEFTNVARPKVGVGVAGKILVTTTSALPDAATIAGDRHVALLALVSGQAAGIAIDEV